MGIDYGSALLLVPDNPKAYSILEKYANEEFDGDFWSAVDELGLDSASPYFDADPSHWDIGVAISRPTYEDLLDQQSPWWDSLNEAKDLLDKLFGEGNHQLGAYQDIT